MLTGTPLTYDEVKLLAKELNRPASTLYALSPHCDPFYIPPARQELATWFWQEVWDRVRPDRGVHLRRLHYVIISLTPLSVLAGKRYENTQECWNQLCQASVAARELGLVDADMFVDRRAGEPVAYIPDDEESDAAIFVAANVIEHPAAASASFRYFTPPVEFPLLPRYDVDAPEFVQPYAIEVWVEKSTINDVLLPLARRLGFTLITGVGELSLTHCHLMVQRALGHGRKVRIIYISDFDPAGHRMPISVARKLEFILRRDGIDLDIRLHPLLLTREQVEDYRLPRTPIKVSDRGRRHFEERHGQGVVELDALEALHPGEIARLVTEAVETYREPTRQAREGNEEAADVVRALADDVRAEVPSDHAPTLTALRARFERLQAEITPHQDALREIDAQIRQRFGARIDQAVVEINANVADFFEHAQEAVAAIGADLEDRMPDPDEVEWPELEEADEDPDPLFDSTRGYVEQIDRYKWHQGKPTAQRNGNGTKGVRS